MNLENSKDEVISRLSDGWFWYVDFITNNTPPETGETGSVLAITLTTLLLVMVSSLILASVMIWRKPLLFLDRVLLARELAFISLFVLQFLLIYADWNNLIVRSGVNLVLFIVAVFLLLGIARENMMSAEEVEALRQRRYNSTRFSRDYRENERRDDWDTTRKETQDVEEERRVVWGDNHRGN